ncbi:class I SAM-dependent methyltransferase [Bradyrhizobium sp. Tv2a-2]|uniref:class I SAM-dependent methyltransferase n=1 Tax=Bradyrhizobium sp. Tv2a-2 TaxID=113395 RepID=UPI00041E45FD|nr:class I SAM-dependent methyltransferase [Bradyrhizobium sp. Tv2a-2]
MDKIREYWNERAVDAKGSPTATTNDVFLRQLEGVTLVARLRDHCLRSLCTILDVGCGDGMTTLELARHFPDARFLGIDFSPSMIEAARSNLAVQPDLGARVAFSSGDARDLKGAVGNQKYDAIITNRCLINIPEPEGQFLALKEIADHLSDAGLFLGSENFIGGQIELDRLRNLMNLPKIPIRWHNLYLDETSFLDECKKHFSSATLENFTSSYYYATRVIYSALCKIENSPVDYEHPIHRVAMQLPPFGDSSPIKLIVAVK